MRTLSVQTKKEPCTQEPPRQREQQVTANNQNEISPRPRNGSTKVKERRRKVFVESIKAGAKEVNSTKEPPRWREQATTSNSQPGRNTGAEEWEQGRQGTEAEHMKQKLRRSPAPRNPITEGTTNNQEEISRRRERNRGGSQYHGTSKTDGTRDNAPTTRKKEWSEGRKNGLVKANNDDHNSEAEETTKQSKQSTNLQYLTCSCGQLSHCSTIYVRRHCYNNILTCDNNKRSINPAWVVPAGMHESQSREPQLSTEATIM
jgi:hypothetical protein